VRALPAPWYSTFEPSSSAHGVSMLRAILLAALLFPVAASSPPHEASPKENPYGDCTKEQHHDLNRKVGEACKSGSVRKCLPWDPCKQLFSKIEAFSQCIMARQALMNICFRGGNKPHREAVNELVNGLCRCIDLLVENGCATTEELDSCATELIRRCL
jgi:hypothetical protein